MIIERNKKVIRLEDLEVWQRARELRNGIYYLIKFLPIEERYNVIRHLRENARGITANIAEGFGRYYYKDSIVFYRFARGCLYEIRDDLYTCFDQNYINKKVFDKYLSQIERVGKLINGLIRSASR